MLQWNAVFFSHVNLVLLSSHLLFLQPSFVGSEVAFDANNLGYVQALEKVSNELISPIWIFIGLSSALKVVWFGGSRTSILTSYLESPGLFTPGVKFSSYSVKPLPRYYSIQTGSKVGTENHNLGNPSHLMTQRSHTPISHNAKMDFSNFFCRVHTSFWIPQSQSAAS